MSFGRALIFTILFSGCYIKNAFSETVDLIIYTYNRPMQMYALCESMEKYFTGLGSTFVICRADDNYKLGYSILQKRFPNLIFKYQGVNPEKDFKSTLFNCLNSCKSNYLMFAVDDIIVKDKVDLTYCTRSLEKYNAYAFFLRLGKNINYCFMQKKASPVPPYKEEEPGLFSYVFQYGIGDWRYPNNNDMTIYRKKDVLNDLSKIKDIKNTWYESAWAKLFVDYNKKGLFFEESKIINLSINVVSGNPNQFSFSWKKRLNDFSVEKLNELFSKQNKKINIERLNNKKYNMVHVSVEPIFISR